MFQRLAAITLLAACLCACGSNDSLTEVVVVVDTDLTVSTEFDRVRITVTAPDGQVEVAEGPITSVDQLPATLGVVHRGGELGDVHVVAEAMLGATVVATREAVFRFINRRVRVIRLDLLRRCIGQECGADMTCSETGCRAQRIGSDEFELYDGPPARSDAGTADAAVSLDAGPDDAAIPMDAGTEAGMVDAGVVCTGIPSPCGPKRGPTAACICQTCACELLCDPVDCTLDCRDGARCTTDARDAAEIDLVCLASECSLDAANATFVRVSCDREASCDVDCTGAESCRVACRGGSACLVHCDSAAQCQLDNCSSMMCPGGEIVCGRACP